MGSLAEVVANSSKEARQAQVRLGLCRSCVSTCCRAPHPSLLCVLRRVHLCKPAAGPPPVPRLQLFREKMESVNAWLHASALPKGLKQRIRAYYAGGVGSCAAVRISGAAGVVCCRCLSALSTRQPNCPHPQGSDPFHMRRCVGAACGGAGQRLGAVPGAAARAAPGSGMGGQPPAAGPPLAVQARWGARGRMCRQSGKLLWTLWSGRVWGGQARCGTACLCPHVVCPQVVCQYCTVLPGHCCRELDEEQRFAVSSALVPLDLTPGGPQPRGL